MDAARCLALACALVALVPASTAFAQGPVGPDYSCVEPVGDPEPGTPEWVERDTKNQECASLRLADQLASPAFGFGNLTQGAELYLDQWQDQVADPAHPRGGVTTLIPGSKAADPFRTVERWSEAGRGRVMPVSFKALNGATLRGHVFAPPATMPRPKGGFPGVVITDGSVQAYEELYFWAAQDLAEAGYVAMTYDVQGQGDSDLAGEDCLPAGTDCSGVPYQQDYNFFQGAEDSLGFFLGDKNPFGDMLDADRVGIAGHSLGAAAVSEVGQCDKRVKAIVAWDNLQAIEGCDGATIAPEHRSAQLINTPALAMTNDYGFWTQPAVSAPDYDAKTAGYEQVRAAGLDAQIVAMRNATHLAYTYIPLVFQSNELGERIASYYTRAWFDLQLKGDPTGFDRLTATEFDGSADKDIGAGTFDPASYDPTDPYSGNVPYRIEGVKVLGAVSFYYRSAYSLDDPRGGHAECEDMRRGC